MTRGVGVVFVLLLALAVVAPVAAVEWFVAPADAAASANASDVAAGLGGVGLTRGAPLASVAAALAVAASGDTVTLLTGAPRNTTSGSSSSGSSSSSSASVPFAMYLPSSPLWPPPVGGSAAGASSPLDLGNRNITVATDGWSASVAACPGVVAAVSEAAAASGASATTTSASARWAQIAADNATRAVLDLTLPPSVAPSSVALRVRGRGAALRLGGVSVACGASGSAAATAAVVPAEAACLAAEGGASVELHCAQVWDGQADGTPAVGSRRLLLTAVDTSSRIVLSHAAVLSGASGNASSFPAVLGVGSAALAASDSLVAGWDATAPAIRWSAAAGGGDVVIERSVLSDNAGGALDVALAARVAGGSGGTSQTATFPLGGGTSSPARVVVLDSTFTRNNGGDGSTADAATFALSGVVGAQAVAARVARCAFTANNAAGSSLAIDLADAPGSEVTVDSCRFVANTNATAAALRIGMAAVSSTTTTSTQQEQLFNVTQCVFVNNSAASSGGALSLAGGHVAGTQLSVSGCTFAGDSAATDGGALSLGAGAGLIAMQDVTVRGAQAGGAGGGIALFASRVTASNVRVEDCAAGTHGGALYLGDRAAACAGNATTSPLQQLALEANVAQISGGAVAFAAEVPACPSLVSQLRNAVDAAASGNRANTAGLFGDGLATAPATAELAYEITRGDTLRPLAAVETATEDGELLMCDKDRLSARVVMYDYFDQAAAWPGATAELEVLPGIAFVHEDGEDVVASADHSTEGIDLGSDLRSDQTFCPPTEFPRAYPLPNCTDAVLAAVVSLPDGRQLAASRVVITGYECAAYSPDGTVFTFLLYAGLVLSAIVAIPVVVGLVVYRDTRLMQESSVWFIVALLVCIVVISISHPALAGEQTVESCRWRQTVPDAIYPLVVLLLGIRAAIIRVRFPPVGSLRGAGRTPRYMFDFDEAKAPLVADEKQNKKDKKKRLARKKKGNGKGKGSGSDDVDDPDMVMLEITPSPSMSGTFEGPRSPSGNLSEGSEAAGTQSTTDTQAWRGSMRREVRLTGWRADWEAMTNRARALRNWLIACCILTVLRALFPLLLLPFDVQGGVCTATNYLGDEFVFIAVITIFTSTSIVPRVLKFERPYFEARYIAGALACTLLSTIIHIAAPDPSIDPDPRAGIPVFLGFFRQFTLTIVLALVVYPKLVLLVRGREERAFWLQGADTEVRELDMNDLELDDIPLASGAFGVVFKGYYLGNPCVTKMLRSDAAQMDASRTASSSGYYSKNGSSSAAASPGSKFTGSYRYATDGSSPALSAGPAGTEAGSATTDGETTGGEGGGGGNTSGGGGNTSGGNTSGGGGKKVALSRREARKRAEEQANAATAQAEQQRQALQQARDEFWQEAMQLSRVPQYSSIVSFFGLAQDPVGNQYLVSELVDGGSLSQLLGNPDEILDDRDLVSVATNIAGAMRVLHEARCLHLDLAARNCLVYKRNPVAVKICDFGLSYTLSPKEVSHGGVAAAGRLFSVRWYEPPTHGTFDFASDVYGFGSVLYELMAQKRPWHRHSNAVANRAIRQGLVLKKPPLIEPATRASVDPLYKLARSCWMQPRDERPSFADIILLLRPVKARVERRQSREERARMRRQIRRKRQEAQEQALRDAGTDTDTTADERGGGEHRRRGKRAVGPAAAARGAAAASSAAASPGPSARTDSTRQLHVPGLVIGGDGEAKGVKADDVSFAMRWNGDGVDGLDGEEDVSSYDSDFVAAAAVSSASGAEEPAYLRYHPDEKDAAAADLTGFAGGYERTPAYIGDADQGADLEDLSDAELAADDDRDGILTAVSMADDDVSVHVDGRYSISSSSSSSSSSSEAEADGEPQSKKRVKGQAGATTKKPVKQQKKASSRPAKGDKKNDAPVRKARTSKKRADKTTLAADGAAPEERLPRRSRSAERTTDRPKKKTKKTKPKLQADAPGDDDGASGDEPTRKPSSKAAAAAAAASPSPTSSPAPRKRTAGAVVAGHEDAPSNNNSDSDAGFPKKAAVKKDDVIGGEATPAPVISLTTYAPVAADSSGEDEEADATSKSLSASMSASASASASASDSSTSD